MTLGGFHPGIMGGGAAPSGELYPDPTIQNIADYVFSEEAGEAVTGALSFNDLLGDGQCAITGGTSTALNAALANSTPYSVTITVANYSSGNVLIRLKTGTYVNMEVDGDGPFTKTVTTGDGTVNVIAGLGESETIFDITHISITA